MHAYSYPCIFLSLFLCLCLPALRVCVCVRTRARVRVCDTYLTGALPLRYIPNPSHFVFKLKRNTTKTTDWLWMFRKNRGNWKF